MRVDGGVGLFVVPDDGLLIRPELRHGVEEGPQRVWPLWENLVERCPVVLDRLVTD